MSAAETPSPRLSSAQTAVETIERALNTASVTVGTDRNVDRLSAVTLVLYNQILATRTAESDTA